MSNQNSSFYALLIGINYYAPNRLSDNSSYKSLKGCVRDIEKVEKFLNQLPTPPNEILKLTASTSENNQPVEPPEQLPTYKNIVKAFQDITQIANPGDRIYIHYSGHGGRAKTIYPQLKGESGQDETLVPTDIGSENGQYLRDLELAYLLQQMVDKNLEVSVILDSCHSGGAARGEDEDVRGLSITDNTVRPPDSLVASPEELIAIWQNVTGETQQKAGMRGGGFLKGMLPEAVKKGYVLLAACQAYESAYEYAFEGTERNGALTYRLLETLKLDDPSKLMLTYKMLLDYIKPKINNKFHQQTPMLIGEGDRLIFGWDAIPSEYTAIVTDIKTGKKQRIKLNLGELQGLERGAEFTIYPFGTKTFSTEQQLALVKLVEVEGATSWGEIQTVFSEQPIKVGDWAMLTLVSANLIRKVYLLEDDTLPQEINQQAALKSIKNSIFMKTLIEFIDQVEKADYFVRVAILDAETAAQYQGEVNDIIYEVCDNTQTPILLRPALKVNEPRSAYNVTQRLIHLAKYQAVENIKNHDNLSPMRNKIAVRLTTQPDPDLALKPEDNPTEITITEGETYSLEIQNNYSQPVYFAVLNLQPNWAISSVSSKTRGLGKVISLKHEEKEIIPLGNLEKKENLQNIYKVCVSVDDTNFQFLELPPLDQQKQPVRDNPKNFLEQLLQEITADQPPDRNVIPAPLPSSKWAVVQFTVKLLCI